jgi:hypothetical protein
VGSLQEEFADGIVNWALENVAIAQHVYGLCVLCPHRNNFEMSLTVER